MISGQGREFEPAGEGEAGSVAEAECGECGTSPASLGPHDYCVCSSVGDDVH